MAKDKRVPIFDGHNDTLLRLTLGQPGSEDSFFVEGKEGHIDLPRAQAGALAGGFFAMFTPTPEWKKQIRWRKKGPKGPVRSKGWDVPLAGKVSQQRALKAVLSMMATLYRLELKSDGRMRVVRTASQLVSCLAKGVFAAIPHVEGAEFLTRDLDGLHVLYEAGLRSLGPVWSRPNIFGHGVPFNFPDSPDLGPGLTPAGKELVRACNELGIIVDLSHLNARGFWDVAAISEAPLVVTHAGAHALCPSPRNLTDDQLKAVGLTEGMVGVNFSRSFLRKDGDWDKRTSLEEIVNHVEYIADLIGIDYVGMGSDFDGTVVPQDLKDAAGLPKLVDALRARGIKGRDLRKVAYENWVRVIAKSWKK